MNLHICNLADRPDLVPAITKQLFHEWQEDYQQLTEWNTQEKLCHFYQTQIAHDAQKIPFALIATVSNDFAAICVISNDDMLMRPDLSPWLCAVFTNERYRNQGLASLLIRETLEYCRKQRRSDLKVLYLWTFSERFARFYSRFGFETIQIVPNHGGHQNAYVMRCRLSIDSKK